MLPGRRSALLVGTVLAATEITTRAQIYSFDELAVPESRSLHTLYAFYVYSHQDAPDKSLGQPFVKFHGVSVHSSEPDANKRLESYESLQLAIVPYTDFWSYVNPYSFCSNPGAQASSTLTINLSPGTSPESVGIFTHTVKHADHPRDIQVPVRDSGVYILALSNCGGITQAAMLGSVIVKNAYGFLPGNEYHKMPFYGFLSFVYTVLALVWMILSLRQWKEVLNIQYCIAMVIFFGLVESFLWLMFYNDWNHSGNRGKFLFTMAILSSVVKATFSYMLVLVASLGWGITRPYLDHRTILKIQVLSAAYIVLDFIREFALSFRHSHSFSMAFVVLCLLPVSLLNGGIFYWIFTALSSLIDTLKERRQAQKLQLFERLWTLLVLAMSVASFALVFQIFDLSRSIAIRWKYQWFVADGLSHIIFLMVLMAMMYLWAPAQSAKNYAYTPAADNDENVDGKVRDVAQGMWADEGIDDDAEDESFWATTHTQAGETKPVGASQMDVV